MHLSWMLYYFAMIKGLEFQEQKDMVKEYESPWFHIIGGIKGTFIGLVVSAMAAGIIWLI